MSNLSHWHARTTSATSSSTSVTPSRSFEARPAWPLPAQSLHPPPARTQSLFHLRDASAVGRGRSPDLSLARPSSKRGVCRSGRYRLPGALPLRKCAESTSGRHLRAQRSLEALPCLHVLPSRSLASSCHVLHTILASAAAPHTLLRKAHHGSRWLQRCSAPAFWFPHVLHAPDAVLHGQPPWRLPWRLPNSGSSVRAHACCGRAGYLNCGLAPCTPDIR